MTTTGQTRTLRYQVTHSLDSVTLPYPIPSSLLDPVPRCEKLPKCTLLFVDDTVGHMDTGINCRACFHYRAGNSEGDIDGGGIRADLLL